MNNAHMGMWSQIHGKPNTLKGLAVLVLDGEVCDEWHEDYDFCQFVTQVWVRKKKIPENYRNAMILFYICFSFLSGKEPTYCIVFVP